MINRLIHLGMHEGLSIDLAKRITMSNWIAWIAITNALVFIWIFSLLGMHYVTATLMLVIAVDVLVLWFNAQKFHTLSRILIVPCHSLCLVFIDYLVIESEAPRLFLYPVAILSFLVYGPKEKYWAVLSTFFAVACAQFITFVTSQQRVGIYHVPREWLPYLDTAISSASLLTTAALVVVFYVENVKAERKIDKEKEKLRFIFDQLEEVVMITDNKGVVQPEYSKFTEAMFDRSSIPNRGILDVLFQGSTLSKDLRDQCNSALQSGFEGDEVQWVANQAQLVRDLEIRSGQGIKHVQVNWQPIYQDELVSGVIVTAQDVTARKNQIELDIQTKIHETNLNEMLQAIHKHSRDAVGKFLISGQRLIDDPLNILTELHRLKGVAHTLGLKQYETDIHEVEALLQSQSIELTTRMNGLMSAFEASYKSFTTIFGSVVEPIRPRTLYEMAPLLLASAKRQAEQAGFWVDGFHVNDLVVDWPTQLSETVSEVLQQAISNSIEQGYVQPAKEKRLGERGIQLHASAELRNGTLALEYRDEGAGAPDAALHALGMTTIKQLISRFQGEVTLLQNPGRPGLQMNFQFPISGFAMRKVG